VFRCRAGEKPRAGKINEVFVYDNFARVAVDQAEAGDICAITGLSDISIGETVCSRESPDPLPTIKASLSCSYGARTQACIHVDLCQGRLDVCMLCTPCAWCDINYQP
jgi:hypothetical protein